MLDILQKKELLTTLIPHFFQDFPSRSLVLNYLFRKMSFIDDQENIIILSDRKMVEIAKNVKLQVEEVIPMINTFLLYTLCFKKTLRYCNFSWNNNLQHLRRKLIVYLHKAHRIAPVFDYKRAKINSERLINLMNSRFYFPRFSTQLALVIFVTDANNSHKLYGTALIQRNLRAFCDCSAFSFHRARNKLRITSQGQVNL